MADYTGWLSVEILPKPEPYLAAKQAIDFLKPFLNRTGCFSDTPIRWDPDR